MQVLNPKGWKRPSGYANGIAAEGRMVFVAGQIGWTPDEVFESDDLVDQFRQALENVRAVLAAGGAEPQHVVRMTIYLRSRKEYLARLREFGAVWRPIFDRHFPAMTAVEVSALIEERAQVEIEVTAVVPPEEYGP